MRGKNILWLSLIATLLMPMLIVSVGTAKVGNTKLSIDPDRIPTDPEAFGHPGDIFDMAIKIENIEDLWSAAFAVQYAPYARPLTVSEVREGPFLAQGGYDTDFTYKVNALKGQLKIGITRLLTPTPEDPMKNLPIEGASGDGTLATFKFTVVEAGDSDIEFIDVSLLDSSLNPMTYKTRGGYYHGVTANLIRIEMPLGRVVHVGDSVLFKSKAINKGDVPLLVRTRFDIERLEDGRRVKIYSGQNYAGGGLGEPLPFEYLYVDGYSAWLEWGWTNPGASLIGPPDGNVASTTTYSDITSMYTFEDIDLAGRVIANVDLEGYTRQEDPGNDIDPYVFAGDVGAWWWADSMGWTTEWAWTGGKYYKGTAYDMPEYYDKTGYLHTQEGINSVEVLLHSYDLSDTLMEIDAMRWKVEFSPITPVDPPVFEILPGEELELDPMTIGTATEDMIGTYVLTATLEYTLAGVGWIEGAKTRTITFEIRP